MNLLRRISERGLLGLLLLASAMQQADSLQLTLHRNFGFRAGDRIQGQFTLSASGPADLQRVEFQIDGKLVGEATESPFEIRFRTSDYTLGVHQLSATGFTQSGGELRSAELQFEFVSAEAGFQAVGSILVPVAIVIIVVTLAGVLGPTVLGRKRKFELGVYGPAGGAVCPRCGKPYSRSLLSLRLVVGKLERCPHCGKWAVVRRASPEQLQAAEQRMRTEAEPPSVAPSDDLQRMIDDSKYES